MLPFETKERQFIGDMLVRTRVLDDVVALEHRRWSTVVNLQECYREYMKHMNIIKQLGGAHVKTRKGWKLFLLRDEEGSSRTLSEFDVDEPTVPKNNAEGQRFFAASWKYERAERWCAKFTTLLVDLIVKTLKSDKRKVQNQEGVINVKMNSRSYVFRCEEGYKLHTGPKRPPKIVLISCTDAYIDSPYQEFNLTVSSPRANVIRSGKCYGVDEIMPLIASSRPLFLHGDRTKTGGKRLRTFAEKGVTCVGCGLVGTRFYKEKEVHGSVKPRAWSLSLYGVTKAGHEVLMTRDHIIPTSKGGSDSLENSQTMCTKCNRKKADIIPKDKEPVRHERPCPDVHRSSPC